MTILTWFPLAYTTDSMDARGSHFLGIIKINTRFNFPAETNPRSIETYAHELQHRQYGYRHPIKSHTSAGKEISEERSHAIEALMRSRRLPNTGFERECDGLALNVVAWDYGGMWPDWKGLPDGERAALLSQAFRKRRAFAEQWLKDNAAHLAKIEAKLAKAR